MSGYVDAHHHVWTLARGDYGWLTPALAPIYRDYTLDDLAPFAAAADITATVLVQAAPTLTETRFLLDAARRSGGRVRGVVGWVDLAAQDATETLHDLAADPLFKSVRPMLQDIDDANWMLRPDIQATLLALPALGVRFDALVKPAHLPALLATLERNPDLDVVIDHAAKPEIATAQWEPWAGLMRAAAGHPHVHCKLSGLPNEAGPAWSAATLRPYVDHLLACFGPQRVMWGSDWPVVGLAGGYARWRAATMDLLQAVDGADRAAVLGGTARRFYALD